MADDILVSSDSGLITADNERGAIFPGGGAPRAPSRAYSLADLVQRIAERLGAVGDGQPVQPEDARKIRNALPGIAADLEERDVYSFPNLEVVPPAAFQHLVAVSASEMSDDFGLPQDEVVKLASRAQAAEQKLRQHRSLPYSGATTRACYF